MRPVFIGAGLSIVIPADNVVKLVVLNFDNSSSPWALNSDNAAAGTHSPSALCFLQTDGTGTASTSVALPIDVPVVAGATLYSVGQGCTVYFAK